MLMRLKHLPTQLLKFQSSLPSHKSLRVARKLILLLDWILDNQTWIRLRTPQEVLIAKLTSTSSLRQWCYDLILYKPQSQERVASVQTSTGLDETQESTDQLESTSLSSPNLASTYFRPSEGVSLDSSLTQLESTLRVATTLKTQLRELLSAPDLSQEHSDPSNWQSNEDNDSSIYEVPSLPSGETRVRFLTDLSAAEKTAEEASHVDFPILYGNNPITSESRTEGGDELEPVTLPARLNRPSTSSVKRVNDGLPELSGRSRASLKTYFDETKSFNLPQGHPTVIFSESQMYHLLRILADETLKMSYNTMERMGLDAVKGTPTTVPSRTDQLRLRARASTPFRIPDSDSSDAAESDAVDNLRIEASDSVESYTLGDISIPEKSDSSGEMALISQSFKRSSELVPNPQVQKTATSLLLGKVPEQECSSSGDATLSEVKRQTLGEEEQMADKGKMPKKSTRQPQRGAPCQKRFCKNWLDPLLQIWSR